MDLNNLLEKLKEIEKMYPNNYDLGAIIRKFIQQLTNNN